MESDDESGVKKKKGGSSVMSRSIADESDNLSVKKSKENKETNAKGKYKKATTQFGLDNAAFEEKLADVAAIRTALQTKVG